MIRAAAVVTASIILILLCRLGAQMLVWASPDSLLVGEPVYGDWRSDAPGLRRYIRPDDLPAPYASASITNNSAVVAKPADAQLKVPAGFQVSLFANGLESPRLIRTAPNGDIFIAESFAGRIRVLRPTDGGDAVLHNSIYASGLRLPFGIAFYPNGNEPRWVYVANTDSVVRFRYRGGDLHADAEREDVVATLPIGGHWTRDIAFSLDNSTMFVSVGSASNDGESTAMRDLTSSRAWLSLLRHQIRNLMLGRFFTDVGERERADVLAFGPEGEGRHVYASGIRNCVGMAVNSTTGDLWCSTNERDDLGDDLPPDYITRVREGGFYGWPWYYIGAHEDPRHKGARPDLKDKIIVPDVLLQPHSASMQMIFYTGEQFPAEYEGNVFAAAHGSWNRSKLTGYKVIRALVKDGVPSGDYEDFVTGFVIDDTQVWGRPVGIAQAKDGSLLFSDDGTGAIWRVSYQRNPHQ